MSRIYLALFSLFLVIALAAAIASFVYTVQKCGMGKALLLGDRGFIVAISGLCD